jgi:hypothetical protein
VAGGASVTSRRRRCAAGGGSGGQRVAGAVDGNARRPRVRACSRCLVARARARTRTSSPRASRKRSRFGWMAFAGDAPPANASCGRVDARSASIVRLTRAYECRSGPCRRTGVAMERRRPGPGLGANDARRVLCGNTQAEGATVADVPRPPVVFAVRVIEDYELCSRVEPFGSFTATRGFFG